MNFQKIFTAAAGLTLLAGLAYHQGNHERQSVVDDSMLMGTAIDTTVQPQEIPETVPETAQSDQPECGEASGLPAQGLEPESPCASDQSGDEASAEAEENFKG